MTFRDQLDYVFPIDHVLTAVDPAFVGKTYVAEEFFTKQCDDATGDSLDAPSR